MERPLADLGRVWVGLRQEIDGPQFRHLQLASYLCFKNKDNNRNRISSWTLSPVDASRERERQKQRGADPCWHKRQRDHTVLILGAKETLPPPRLRMCRKVKGRGR